MHLTVEARFNTIGPQSIGQKLTGAQLLPAGEQDGNGVPSKPLIRLITMAQPAARTDEPNPPPPTSQY